MNIATIKALCEHGADMKVLTHHDRNILHLAADVAANKGAHAILDYLIKAGKVDINDKD